MHLRALYLEHVLVFIILRVQFGFLYFLLNILCFVVDVIWEACFQFNYSSSALYVLQQLRNKLYNIC